MCILLLFVYCVLYIFYSSTFVMYIVFREPGVETLTSTPLLTGTYTDALKVRFEVIRKVKGTAKEA